MIDDVGSIARAAWKEQRVVAVLEQDRRVLLQHVLVELEPQPPIDKYYEGDGPVRFGKYEVHVHHTPGHCPGGVCLAVKREGSADHILFVGDTLFAGSIGRTDLPGGNLETLLTSIREVLFAFPDTTPVYSGHGEPTTIGRERKTNPFLAM